jgi:acyl-CoA thioester hydrolase
MEVPVPDVFAMPLTVRYAEVDQQGVVFNAHYLTWFDEAMTAFLIERGLPYPAMTEAGYDVMLVRSEIDWRAGVRWLDEVAVQVSPARFGRTSFILDFAVVRDGEAVVDGRTVYVCVGADDQQPREIPGALRDALGPAAPLRPVP